MTETRIVSGRIAARTSSGSTIPSPLTGRIVISNPSRASAEKGRHLMEIAVERLVELVRELESGGETAGGDELP
jgi:creatinine amidohydrolase/Fe(II)-dependent formamide hydrolase-like protein